MSDTASKQYESFEQHAATVGRHFETRRKIFLKQLKFRCLVAGVLLLTFPFWYSLLTRWDALEVGLSSLGLLVVHALAALTLIVLIIAFALRPMFRYRYDTLNVGGTMPGASGPVHQSVLLKSRIFTKLLSFFGEFTMYEERRLSLRRFQKAPNLPVFDSYLANDYVRGTMQNVRVEMAEGGLYTHRGGESQNVFSGLMILIDINDAKNVLHGNFSGQTVMLLDAQVNEVLLEKYEGFKRVQLADSSFGQQVTALSTHTDEAQRLLNSEFVVGILKLSEALQKAQYQESAVDDKIALALEKVATGLGDILAAAGMAIMQWFKTGRFGQISQRHGPLHASAQADTADAQLFSGGAQCCFFEDKIFISLPTKQNLFEPDSLFHPPLTAEDIKLSYAIMNNIGELVKVTLKNLNQAHAGTA